MVPGVVFFAVVLTLLAALFYPIPPLVSLGTSVLGDFTLHSDPSSPRLSLLLELTFRIRCGGGGDMCLFLLEFFFIFQPFFVCVHVENVSLSVYHPPY